MSRRKVLFAHLVPSSQLVETRIPAWSKTALRSVAVVAALALGAAGAAAQAAFPNENVGSSSPGQAVQVTASAAGTVSTIEVLTAGEANLDFASDGALTTCSAATLAVTQSCNVGVTFTPSAPGTRIGAAVLLDSSNNVLGTTYIYGAGIGSLATFVPGNVGIYAGIVGENLGLIGDGGPATSAELYLPSGVAFDGAGNLYIADNAHNRVRMVCAGAASGIIKGTQAKCTAAGIIINIAGGGSGCAGDKDTFGDGCAATSSALSSPSGVTVDGAGNLYIADTGNDLIRKVNAVSGVITVVAGNLGGASALCAGKTDNLGDGCPATQALLDAPQGATFDVFGNLYIADTSNNRIRLVAPSGVITSFAGGAAGCGAQTNTVGDGCTAIEATLGLPYPVAFDASGNMYIPDSSNNRVRKVTATGGVVTSSSTITTFAGTGAGKYLGDGGPAKSADLFAPSGVAIDPAQDVYIADTQNSAIRVVNVGTLNIETIISPTNNQAYLSTQKPPFMPISFYEPVGLTFDSQGDLFIADTLEMVVQEMQSNLSIVDLLPPPSTNAIRVDSLSTPQLITVENIGNSPLTLTAITPATNAQVDAATTTCSTGSTLGVGHPCIVGAVFAPTTVADPLVTNIDVTGQTANSPLDIEIVGDAEALNSTTTTVTSAPNPSIFSQKVVFTVGITTGTGTLSGTVTITDTFNGTLTTLMSNLAVKATGTSASATFPISTLAVGQHTIVAEYNGDGSHTSSTSTDNDAPALQQIVNEFTTTTLASSVNPSALGQSVTFTATVAAPDGGGIVPDGTVTFMSGATVLGAPQTLPPTGIVTYATAALPLGTNPITAVYSGDATIYVLGSTSTVLNQDVGTTSTVAVTSTPNPSNYGTQVTFTATVTPGTTTTVAPTGTVTFLDNGTQIGTGTLSGNPATAVYQTTSLAVGTHPISVSYAGDADFSGSTSTVIDSQVVQGVPTTIAVTANPNPGIAGVPEPITATITSTANASLLTGSVTFTNGATTLGTGTLTNGTATINPVLAANTYQVVATYAGNSNLGGSTSPAYPLVINTATSVTTLTVTPTTAPLGSAITFSATVTSNGVAPTGMVTFMDGATVLGTPQTLANGIAVLTDSTLAVGMHSITAVYSGDVDNGVSTSAAVTLTIGLIPTTTDLVASATTTTPPELLLVAVVVGQGGPTPTGTVTFTTGSTTIGSATLDSSGVATISPNLPNGSFQVVASYSGDIDHSPSQSTPVTISGAPAQFSLTVTPNTLSMTASQNAPVVVNVTSVGGFTDTVSLGCAALPAGVTCTFANPTVTLAANATVTSQLIIDTNSPLSGGPSAMNSNRGSSFRLAGLFLPFSVIFGFAFWRMRRRTASFLTMALVAVLSLGALVATGCNSFGSSTVTPGTYTVVITGTGTQSNTIHYTTLTLNITK